MEYIFTTKNKRVVDSHMKVRGFVLPFTLLICAIMLLISVGISSVLAKQIYFSNLGRESQMAYYAADNALACVTSIEETYVFDASGIFPYSSTTKQTEANLAEMSEKLNSINQLRSEIDPPLLLLAPTINDIKCAQSNIFNTSVMSSNFEANTLFTRIIPAHDSVPEDTEYGITSTFNMKMDVGNGEYRCAKVTVNKTPTFKQIIAQGYSKCNRPGFSVERAVVYTTVQ